MAPDLQLRQLRAAAYVVQISKTDGERLYPLVDRPGAYREFDTLVRGSRVGGIRLSVCLEGHRVSVLVHPKGCFGKPRLEWGIGTGFMR